MTIRHTTRWQHIAVTAGIFAAAMSFAAATATPAYAVPKNPKPGKQQYIDCWDDAISAWREATGAVGMAYPPADVQLQQAEKCCTDLGGIFNNGTTECYLPNGDTYRVSIRNAPPGQQAPDDLPEGLSDQRPGTRGVPPKPVTPPLASTG